MTEFWEKNFRKKQEMWGFTPANSAVFTADLFSDKGFKKILIPGTGYGRNAQAFLSKGMQVTGIEISETAIGLAEKHYGESLTIHHGSVADMPYDQVLYDGIFCHALIHLLDEHERAKLIADCYSQLSENGLMVFTSVTKDTPTYGEGILIGKDRYEQFGGIKMFFYDQGTIRDEFDNYGLTGIKQVAENYPFYMIICEKK